MNMEKDIKFGNDIYDALNKNQIPAKIAHIVPDFEDLPEGDTSTDETEEDAENDYSDKDNRSSSSL